MLKRILLPIITVLTVMILLTVSVSADEASYANARFDVRGFSSPENVFDDSKATYSESYGTPKVTVSRDDSIGGVYVIFDKVPSAWSIKNKADDVTVQCGTNGFLHEYVAIDSSYEGDVTELELIFAEGTVVTEIYVFSKGDLPDWVQVWEPQLEKADLMLLPSHADDEQLFFAGVLPYYAVERGMKVQVVYLVNHNDTHERPHELLDGLWTVGIRNYPEISNFPDLYSESTDRTVAKNNALAAYEQEGYTFEDFVEYITACIRRFKPIVLVSHDTNGEYGHGTHVVAADAIAEALKCSMNAAKYPESAEKYGKWIPDKVYLHLYPENPLTLDIDTPYDSLGGKTPFQVTQEGFRCHKTQLWTWFGEWIYGTTADPITKATQIEDYSPCKYGLFYSSVGPDKISRDFFENTNTHEGKLIDAETQTAVTLAPVETLPSELIIGGSSTDEAMTENSVDQSSPSDSGNVENNNQPAIIAIVLAAVTICIVIVIFTVGASRTNTRTRRRKKINRNRYN